MASRKAQIEIHFSWIFALIAGAVILGFFIVLIRNVQDRAVVVEKDDMAVNLDTILAGITTTPETTQVIELPSVTIEFTCEEGISSYHLKGSQRDQDTGVDVLFAPAVLSGEKLIAWTRTWRVPFPAATFTYLSDERTLFIFVAGDEPELAKDLYDELPVGYQKLHINWTDIDSGKVPRGYDRYRYIFVGGPTAVVAADAPSLGGEMTEMAISSAGGKLTASFGEGATQTVSLPGQEALWAAVFSGDGESYACGMQKAYRRLEATAALLQDRSGSIAEEMRSSPCYDYFKEAETILGEIATAAKDGGDAMIVTDAVKLAEIQDITTRYTCPDIY